MATSFTNQSKSNQRAFGTYTFDEVGSNKFISDFNGIPVGNLTFESLVYDVWTNQSKN